MSEELTKQIRAIIDEMNEKLTNKIVEGLVGVRITK